MTAQINDRVFYRKIDFDIAGVSGSGLFEPQQHGCEPKAISSACWRGFYVQYTIEDDQLFLTQVTVGLSDSDVEATRAGRGPKLFGKQARYMPLRRWVYDGLREPIAFSGGLLLGDVFIRELYVHMGFHPAWKYRDVREVLFEQGRLSGEFDRSSEMAALRARLSAQPLKPATVGEIGQWVKKCFSRDYSR